MTLLLKSESISLRFLNRAAERDGSDSQGEAGRNGRRRDAQRAAERAEQWFTALQDMLREISEPDPAPSFRDTKLWVGTWNMGNAAPDAEQVRHWLGLDTGLHAIYAVGLQESTFPLSKEEKRFGSLNTYIGEVLLSVLGTEYHVLEVKSMWEIRLLLIAHDEILPHIEVLDTATEATGIGGVGGNKGGVGIAISLHRTTVCFVTAHLAAHQHMTAKRNADCYNIFKGMRSLAATKIPGTKQLDPSICFDHVFFFGDLNYRLAAPMEAVLDIIEEDQPEWTRLHVVDQLREEQNNGRVLSGFNESPPLFAPTFKRIKSGKKGADLSTSRLSMPDSTGEERLSGSEGGSGGGTPWVTGKSKPKIDKGGGGTGGGFNLATLKRVSAFGKEMFAPSPGQKTFKAPPSSGPNNMTILEDDAEADFEDGDSVQPNVGSGAAKTDQSAVGVNEPAIILDRAGQGSRTSLEGARTNKRGSLPASESEEEIAGGSGSGGPSGALAEVEQAARAFSLGYNAQRIPSWCDRVLWRSHPMCYCELTSYQSIPAVETSDHTPVCATFGVRVLLPSNTEESAGDRHQWDLSIGDVKIRIPLAALEEEDALAAAVAVPELLVEFCGNFIRTGYTTPPLACTLSRDASGSNAFLVASFSSAVSLAMTDLSQKFGPQRIILSHLIMQVVALFGSRRVTLVRR